MLKRFYQCLFALMLSGSAFADSGYYSGSSVADSGFYIGAKIGHSTVSKSPQLKSITAAVKEMGETEGLSFSVNNNLSGSSMGLLAGYQFNPYIAVEVDFMEIVDGGMSHYLGDEVARVAVDAKIKRYALSVLPSYPINSRLSVYSRLGYSYSKADYSATIHMNDRLVSTVDIGEGYYPLDSENDESVLVGIGFNYHPNDYYMRFEIQKDFSFYDALTYSLDFGYRF